MLTYEKEINKTTYIFAYNFKKYRKDKAATNRNGENEMQVL